MESIMGLAVIAVVSIVGLAIIGFIVSKLYTKSSKGMSYVRTGLGGQRVVMSGGSIVLPVFHDVIHVNMNTLKLEVTRANQDSLITKDKMRVDVSVEFYVRVAGNEESIANAAQTLGNKTLDSSQLRELVEGKFVDSLRHAAAGMSMKELHEQRAVFVQKVQQVVAEDLTKNGLELESVSLTRFDQTKKEYFDPNNAFDAEGLTRLTEEIEGRRKSRNDIERETEVQIQHKNYETNLKTLDINRKTEEARLAQEQEIAALRAAQEAEVARTAAEGQKQSEQAKISSEKQVKESRIIAERELGEAEAQKKRVLETAQLATVTAIQLADQDNAIAIADKSKKESEARAAADLARASAVAAAEEVETVRASAVAEREKRIQIIEARKRAEEAAISVTVEAEAKLQAAESLSAAEIKEANGHAEAAKLRAAAVLVEKEAVAKGTREINEAENLLSVDQIAMRVKLQLIQSLPEIIMASVEPLKSIDSIKIAEIGGVSAMNGSAVGAGASGGGDSLPEQVVKSAMKYRAMAPLVDSLMSEVGLKGGSLAGLIPADFVKPAVPSNAEGTFEDQYVLPEGSPSIAEPPVATE